MLKNSTLSRWSRLAVSALLVSALGACMTPPAQPVAVQPQALALGLTVTEDGGLAPDALEQVNELLRQQGRISRQTLTVAPLSTQGVPMAARLAEALRQAGASDVAVLPLAGMAAQEAALAQGWDLELRSESIAVQAQDCGPANKDLNRWPLTSHPYWSLGPLGCANRHNLAQMVSDPRDLIQPKVLESADGVVTAEAVRRYHEDEVKDLVDIDFDE
ncbi:MAG: CpaD family pilus assembly lipoprotein [Corticimicrobacter sp.]|uniref:CpaD family pilus assembly lipoprotein n=1 Tax=Corticimicrobacter sp. TaxID=2678536 RepID=UPI0032D9E2DB